MGVIMTMMMMMQTFSRTLIPHSIPRDLLTNLTGQTGRRRCYTHRGSSFATKRKHPLTMHSGIQSAPPHRVRRVGSRVGSRERENFSRVGCPPSCLHQVRNKDMLLSWLPVVCPVRTPTAGYRTPSATTRYLSTANYQLKHSAPGG